MDRADFWHRSSSPQAPSCIGWGPLPLFWGKLGAPKFWVQWEGIGKSQAIVMKFCTATTLGPRNMPAKFQLNRPQIGELGPKFGAQCNAIKNDVAAAARACWIELKLLNDGKTWKTPSWLKLSHRLCLSVRGLYKNDRSAILALARLLLNTATQ